MAKYQELMGSTSGWGYLAACKALPFLLLGPLSGYLVDKKSRRWLIVASDSVRFVLVMGIAFCSSIPIFFTLVFLTSCFETIYFPAMKSFATQMLPPSQLLRFNSLEETMRSLLNIVGVGLSGALLGIIGVKSCFIVDALSFFASATNVLLLRLPAHTLALKANLEASEANLQSGWRMILQNKAVWFPIALWTFIVLLVAFESPLLFPLVVLRNWPGGASAAGYIFASASLGALIASLGFVQSFTRFFNLWICAIVLAFDALALQILGTTSQFAVGLGIAFIFGVTEVLFRTFSVTTIQYQIPKHAVGRIFASIAMVQEPIRVVAMAGSGAIVSHWSVESGFWCGVYFEYAVALLTILYALSKWKRHV